MIIFGAGMAGLLAAHKLRRFAPRVIEAQSALPHNHDALLRFRSDAVSRATGIPFKEVEVVKCIQLGNRTFSHPDIRCNNLYSRKVAGIYMARSISDLRPAKRWIAPDNFVEQLAAGVRQIEFGKSAEDFILSNIKPSPGQKDLAPFISTIPMPLMMKIINWPKRPSFNSHQIFSLTAKLSSSVDLYQTIYYPDPDLIYYRASITGCNLIIELIDAPIEEVHSTSIINEVMNNFGLLPGDLVAGTSKLKKQTYGKIAPIDEDERQMFILALTDKYSIYSLGRFATWRQILLDDVVTDIERIEDWVTDRSGYRARLMANSGK